MAKQYGKETEKKRTVTELYLEELPLESDYLHFTKTYIFDLYICVLYELIDLTAYVPF